MDPYTDAPIWVGTCVTEKLQGVFWGVKLSMPLHTSFSTVMPHVIRSSSPISLLGFPHPIPVAPCLCIPSSTHCPHAESQLEAAMPLLEVLYMELDSDRTGNCNFSHALFKLRCAGLGPTIANFGNEC